MEKTIFFSRLLDQGARMIFGRSISFCTLDLNPFAVKKLVFLMQFPPMTSLCQCHPMTRRPDAGSKTVKFTRDLSGPLGLLRDGDKFREGNEIPREKPGQASRATQTLDMKSTAREQAETSM